MFVLTLFLGCIAIAAPASPGEDRTAPASPSASPGEGRTAPASPSEDERLREDYPYLLERINELEARSNELRRELRSTTEAREAAERWFEGLREEYDELEREHERYKQYYRAIHR